MNNREVASTLEQIADILELLGETSFRANAYRNSGRRIERLPEDINELASRDALTSIQGVGARLAETISEMLAAGRSDLLDQLSFNVSPGLLDLLTIPGLGPKRARAVHLALGVTTLADLSAAARDGRLAAVSGFGGKTAESIVKALENRERWASRRLSSDVVPAAATALEALRAIPGVSRAEIAGSLRRRRETVGNVNLVASASDHAAALAAFAASPAVARSPDGDLTLADGTPATVAFAAVDGFGAAWVRATGSPGHVARLESLARDRGVAFEGESEEGLYASVGLPWIPPELREDRGELAAAAERKLPSLLGPGDLRGDLHMHSLYSDGASSIRDMALACIARGYAYMAITDHSQGLGVANGLTPERLVKQAAEVDVLNAELAPFRILKGSEVDIRADGTLDFPDEVLDKLDWVVASVHSAFGRPREEQSARVERALRNPYVNLLAHPSGRILGRREGIQLDIERLLEVAAETGTALEINCGPDRLDLDDLNARSAAERGIPICINADAHHPEQLAWVTLGEGQARRAWLTAGQVLNAGPLEAVMERVTRKRAGNHRN